MADYSNLLLELWKHTRGDLDAAQERFRKTITLFLAGSFGLSAFLLSERTSCVHDAFWAAIADLMFIAIFLAMMVRYLKDITLARGTVEWYEDRLKAALDPG